MERSHLNDKLSRHDLSAHANILSLYEKLGESETAIQEIEFEVERLAESDYEIASILPNYRDQVELVEVTREHKIIQLKQHNNFKVTIHIIPSMYEIPAHLHPGLISVINVQYGALQIEQLSLSNHEKIFDRIVKDQQSCAGLINFRNIHAIQSLHSPCVFLSYRIAKASSFKRYFKKIFLFLTSTMVLILSGATGSSLVAKESKVIDISKHYQNISSNKVTQANKLRIGEGVTQDLYSAAQLYQQEAFRGNAEAQYWLSVMYLEGLGITDDSDEALRWVALSADQNYPPAQRLLQHMLVTDDVLDC